MPPGDRTIYPSKKMAGKQQEFHRFYGLVGNTAAVAMRVLKQADCSCEEVHLGLLFGARQGRFC